MTPDVRTPSDVRPADLVTAAFDVDRKTGVWIERAGRTTRGQRPRYLDWPSHTAAEMAREPWPPTGRDGKAVRR